MCHRLLGDIIVWRIVADLIIIIAGLVVTSFGAFLKGVARIHLPGSPKPIVELPRIFVVTKVIRRNVPDSLNIQDHNVKSINSLEVAKKCKKSYRGCCGRLLIKIVSVSNRRVRIVLLKVDDISERKWCR
jgi:hypothetical protein